MLNNLPSTLLKLSKKLLRLFLSSSYFSLVLIPLLMSKELLLHLMYLLTMAVSSIFPWVKVKKIEPRRLSLTVLKRVTGLCSRMSISCKVGCMVSMVLKVSLKVYSLLPRLILTSVSSFHLNLLMFYSLSCKLFLNLSSKVL